MKVIDNFVGRRNKEDNAYLQEVKELITDFILDNSIDLHAALENYDDEAVADMVENWLNEDCHTAED